MSFFFSRPPKDPHINDMFGCSSALKSQCNELMFFCFPCSSEKILDCHQNHSGAVICLSVLLPQNVKDCRHVLLFCSVTKTKELQNMVVSASGSIEDIYIYMFALQRLPLFLYITFGILLNCQFKRYLLFFSASKMLTKARMFVPSSASKSNRYLHMFFCFS
jgi:hypothetical protein